jgi:hypothetical protein
MRRWLARLFRSRRPRKKPAESRRGAGSAMFAAGALELQALLQPDRKVEIVLGQVKEPDRLDPAHRPSRPDTP